MNNKIYRILKFLKEHKIENAFINDDYTVDIIGNVDLSKCGLHYMPIKFNNVTGNFDCSYNNLTSLKNCPKKVGGNFDCTGNDINLEEVSVENYKGLFLYNENENNKLLNAKCLSESKLLNENNIKDEIQKLESEIADLEKTEEELIADNRWSNDPREEILKRRNRIKDVRDLLKTKRIELKELKRRASFYYIEDEELDDEDLPDDIYGKIRDEQIKQNQIKMDPGTLEKIEKLKNIADQETLRKELDDKIEYWKNKEINLNPEYQKISKEISDEREKYINNILDNASDDKKDLINNALKFLKDHNITGFTFNKGTYSINVNGNVNLDNCELEELPVQFLNVKGSFSIKNNYISNLHGCPLYVGGDFDCSNNEDLESLEDGPYKVNGNFNCSGCVILDSLEYSPEYVGGDYHCENTDITSLNGIGEVNGEIYSTFKDVIKKKVLKYDIRNVIINDNGTINVNGSVILSNKELLKIPFDFNEVTGDFKITDNGLTSLEGCPRKVGGNFWCNNNPITSLNGGPVKVGGNYMCSNCKSLSTLDGAPISVGGKFYCQMNNIDDQEFEKLDPQVRGKLVN